MESNADGEETIAVFVLGGETYGVDTRVVSEIARMQDIAPVPHTPAYLDGVINLRGRVIPVVDLRTRFGLPRTPHNEATRIVIVELRAQYVGMIVDAVAEIRTIRTDQIDGSAMVVAKIDGNFIRGILKSPDGLVIMLDLVEAFVDRLAEAA